MAKRKKMSEQELAAILVSYLENDGWEVFQEVDTEHWGIADIIAKRDGIIWAIETKTSLNLDVMQQAWRKRPHAHFISVAFPAPRRRAEDFATQVCKTMGIGILHISSGVLERNKGVAFKKIGTAISSRLREEHKTYAKAGSAKGGYWTPYKDTCEKLLAVVQAEPGIRVKDAVLKIQHHYKTNTTAAACLVKWSARGTVPGIRFEAGCFFPKT